jgi:2-hydroxy-6-oxonona-2,4-dienedioate hydrolase
LDYRYLKVDDICVRYVDLGKNGGGGDKAALLLHGLGGSIDSWRKNIEEISRSLHVIALDLPGFGQSDKPRVSYTIKFYREFVFQFLESLGINKTSIIGSSLGGHIAAEVALAHPDVLRKLVLISPAGALPFSFKGTAALRSYAKVIDAKSVQQVRQALFAVDGKSKNDNNDDEDNSTNAQLVFQNISVPGAKDAFLSALKGSAQAPRLNSRLNRIQAPTLLLWGKEDVMIPVRFIWPFITMKKCRIMLLESCGHRPYIERPQLFNKVVIDFLIC